MTRADLRRPAELIALAVIYFLSAKLGLSIALVHASASPVWPPTGIALAAFLLLGGRIWPAIFAGAFLANATTQGDAATSLAIAAGNTIEALIGALLVERFAGGIAAFDRPRDVFRFVPLAGLAATAISATIGVTSLCIGGLAPWSSYASIWLTWWLGDAGGAVVVAPALILWFANPRSQWSGAEWLEVAALLAATVVIGTIAFSGIVLPPARTFGLAFLCLPLVIWSAFSFGPRETATIVLLLSAIAAGWTLRESAALPLSTQNEHLMLLQVFMGVLAVTALSLAAVVAQRRRALESLEQQAAELAHSNAELQEFAHVVSHDLKAPLRGMSALTTWLVEDCKAVLSEESRDHLQLLHERAARMTQLIDGVLDYARVGRKPVVLHPVDSQEVLDEVIDSLGPTGDVRIRSEGRLPLVPYDRTELMRIFQNLTANAVQHLGKPSGEVIVSCLQRRGDFEFRVRDDGVGIPEAQLERIFKMFHTLDPQKGTTGIGLAIVKKIVERHGGRVTVESTVGVGTTFCFSVPERATVRAESAAR